MAEHARADAFRSRCAYARNRVTSLKDFAGCASLQELYLRKNEARRRARLCGLPGAPMRSRPGLVPALRRADAATRTSAQVADLAQVRHLGRCRALRVLWLCDNPCATAPDYRARCECPRAAAQRPCQALPLLARPRLLRVLRASACALRCAVSKFDAMLGASCACLHCPG